MATRRNPYLDLSSTETPKKRNPYLDLPSAEEKPSIFERIGEFEKGLPSLGDITRQAKAGVEAIYRETEYPMEEWRKEFAPVPYAERKQYGMTGLETILSNIRAGIGMGLAFPVETGRRVLFTPEGKLRPVTERYREIGKVGVEIPEYIGRVFGDYATYISPLSTSEQKQQAIENIATDPMGIGFATGLVKGGIKGGKKILGEVTKIREKKGLPVTPTTEIIPTREEVLKRPYRPTAPIILGEKPPTGKTLIVPPGLEPYKTYPPSFERRPFVEPTEIKGRPISVEERATLKVEPPKPPKLPRLEQKSSIDGEIVKVGVKSPQYYHYSYKGWVNYRTKQPAEPKMVKILEDFVRPKKIITEERIGLPKKGIVSRETPPVTEIAPMGKKPIPGEAELVIDKYLNLASKYPDRIPVYVQKLRDYSASRIIGRQFGEKVSPALENELVLIRETADRLEKQITKPIVGKPAPTGGVGKEFVVARDFNTGEPIAFTKGEERIVKAPLGREAWLGNRRIHFPASEKDLLGRISKLDKQRIEFDQPDFMSTAYRLHQEELQALQKAKGVTKKPAVKEPWEMTRKEFEAGDEYWFHGAPKSLNEIKAGSYFGEYFTAKQYAKGKGGEKGRVYYVRKGELKPIEAEPTDKYGTPGVKYGFFIRSGIPHKGIEMPLEGHKGLVRQALSEGKMPYKGWEKDYPDLVKKAEVSKAGEVPPSKAFITPSRPQMPLEMERVAGKPQDLPSIVQKLSTGLKAPIRLGYYRKARPFGLGKAMGIYKEKPEVVRIATANDMVTIGHEVAHHIDKKFNIKSLIEQNPEIAKEVKTLDYDQTKLRTEEGFAEFVRHWLTDDTAPNVAPQANIWFENFLRQHPEVESIIRDAKADIGKWRSQGAESRIQATLVNKPTRYRAIGERLKDAWLETRYAISDNLAPIEKFVTESEKKLGKLPLERENPFAVATAVRNSSGTKALQWFNEATSNFDGNVTGPPLRTIFQGVKGKEWEALRYAYAKHAIERWNRGKNPGVAKIDAEYYVQKYTSPEFELFARELTSYSDRLLDYVIDSGGLSKETADIFRGYYENYIPLFREMEIERPIGHGGGRGYADMPDPIKKAVGSGRRVIDPLTGLMINTQRLIAWADRARVGKLVADLAEKTGGMGEWVEKVEVPPRLRKIRLQDIAKELEKKGIKLEIPEEYGPEVMQEFMNFWITQQHGMPKDNIVTFFTGNGELQAYQLKPQLYRAITKMDGITLPYALQVVTAPVRWGKKAVALGATGLRASFGWGTNLVRDPLTYFMQSVNPKANPLQALGATPKVIKNKLGWNPTEAWRLFQQQGGEFGTFMNTELPRVMKTARRVIADNRRAKALNVLRHPFELYREIINIPESGPRYAEFQSVYKKRLAETGDHRSAWISALNASKEVTINFSRYGYMTQIANQFIPFFGPSVAGTAKVFRSFRTAPIRTTIRGLTLTGATLALWQLNKDEDWYKALPDWDKYGFWHFKFSDAPDAPIYRLPRPFDWGLIYASIPEATINKMYAEDPDAINELFGVAWEQITPPVMPAGIGTIVDITRGEQGWDPFRDRPIVPQYQVETLPPEKRYGRYTTETAKRVGATLGVSPSKVDYLISGLTGGGALDIIRGAESIIKPTPEKRGVTEVPILGRFVSYDPFVNAFYEQREKVSRAYANLRKLEPDKQAGIKYYRKHPELRLKSLKMEKDGQEVSVLNWTENILSEIRKGIEQVKANKNLSAEQKKLLIEKGNAEMIMYAREAVQRMNRVLAK